MVEAFVGLVGGGKSFSSVKRMCNYIASGGVVVSNILLTGYDADSKSFAPDSPVLKYLRDVYSWEYQDGQYQYISFDDMATLPGWFHRVPGGQSRDKRTFLLIDEATDLFDSLDRGRLNNDSIYREMFRFLRLSRHAHIDVLFICQDINAINPRLRALVGCFWRSTDMSNFRIGGLRIAVPINCFLVQQFDRTGKLELRREFVAKDKRIFTLYQSEAFHDSLGCTFSEPVKDGRIKRKDEQMTKGEKFCFYGLCAVVVWLAFSSSATSRKVGQLQKQLQEKPPAPAEAKVVEEKKQPSKFQSFLPLGKPSPEKSDEVSDDKPRRHVIRGVFDFVGANNGNYCYIDGDLYRVGMMTEYGLCKVVSKNAVICVDGLEETVILPCRKSSPGVDASAASF